MTESGVQAFAAPLPTRGWAVGLPACSVTPLPSPVVPGATVLISGSQVAFRGYTLSVFPTADTRGQKLPVYRVSELCAQMRLCLHRPFVTRQLWVTVVISA